MTLLKMTAGAIRQAIEKSAAHDTTELVDVWNWEDARMAIEAASPSRDWHHTDVSTAKAQRFEAWGYNPLHADGVLDWRITVTILPCASRN